MQSVESGKVGRESPLGYRDGPESFWKDNSCDYDAHCVIINSTPGRSRTKLFEILFLDLKEIALLTTQWLA